MRIIALAIVAIVLAGCASQVIEANSRRIVVEKGELGQDPQEIADAHCKRFDRKAQIYAVEPTSFVTSIYYFDCV